jgi:hypothetical protein
MYVDLCTIVHPPCAEISARGFPGSAVLTRSGINLGLVMMDKRRLKYIHVTYITI